MTEVLVELSCPPPNLDKNVTETIVVGETVLGEAGWERGRCVVAHTRATKIPEGGVVRYIFPHAVGVPPAKQGPRFVAPTNPPVSISPNPPKLASNAP
ncbi:MAG: hypothetical protein HOV80_05495 [Polyangiaceae bacterium]|nr:hypothetical protein [Polyangiaceae bacterium]